MISTLLYSVAFWGWTSVVVGFILVAIAVLTPNSKVVFGLAWAGIVLVLAGITLLVLQEGWNHFALIPGIPATILFVTGLMNLPYPFEDDEGRK